MVLMLVHLTVSPAAYSITIQEEEELSREFLRVVRKQFDLIQDPFVVGYVNKIGRNILQGISAIKEFMYISHAYHCSITLVNTRSAKRIRIQLRTTDRVLDFPTATAPPST